MKTADFIRGLECDDYFVRSNCLTVLANRAEPPIEASLAAWRSLQKYGQRESFVSPSFINRLPLNDELFIEALKFLEKEPKSQIVHHLLSWLVNAPLELLEKHLAKLKALPTKPFDTDFGNHLTIAIEKADFRASVLACSGADLIAQHDDIFQRCVAGDDFPHDEIATLEIHAEALAEDREALTDEQIIAWLRSDIAEDSDGPEYWKAGFAVVVARHRKLEVATPYVLDVFDLDGDWLQEEISEFLKSTSSAEVWRSILSELPGYDESSSKPVYLAGALEQCPAYPELEELAISALEMTGDFFARTSLAAWLAKLGTPGGKDAAYQFFLNYEDDPDVHIIPDHLHTVYFLQGSNPGNTEKFRKIVEADYEHDEALLAEYPIMDFIDEVSGKLDNLETVSSVYDFNHPFSFASIEPEPKVGRNKPCPCGSGKKHKICCMKKAG